MLRICGLAASARDWKRAADVGAGRVGEDRRRVLDRHRAGRVVEEGAAAPAQGPEAAGGDLESERRRGDVLQLVGLVEDNAVVRRQAGAADGERHRPRAAGQGWRA